MTSSWEKIFSESITDPAELAERLKIDPAPLIKVCGQYPLLINPYLYTLMRTVGEPLMRQLVPDIRELSDTVGMEDPLAEDRDSPVRHITHRYPDRVLFLISSRCAGYCRFCTRKRKTGKMDAVTDAEIIAGLTYIKSRDQIRDVLLSGGDPLLLSDERLDWILAGVRSVPHVDIIRIGTRVPGFLPERITPGLVKMLRKHQPLYFNLHFNHPAEITQETAAALSRLADAGFPLGSQTVLLRGINDSTAVLTALVRTLLKVRVRPYYLLQGDLTRGTDHFRTPVETGLEILREMRGHVSGLAIPVLVMDLPGGGGKIPLTPDYVVKRDADSLTVRNYQGDIFCYPEVKTS